MSSSSSARRRVGEQNTKAKENEEMEEYGPNTRTGAEKEEDDDNGTRAPANVHTGAPDEDEMRYYYRAGHRFVPLRREDLTCPHMSREARAARNAGGEHLAAAAEGRDARDADGAEEDEDDTAYGDAQTHAQRHHLAQRRTGQPHDVRTRGEGWAIRDRHITGGTTQPPHRHQPPPCVVYVRRRNDTDQTPPLPLGRLNPYCEVCCVKYRYLWCDAQAATAQRPRTRTHTPAHADVRQGGVHDTNAALHDHSPDTHGARRRGYSRHCGGGEADGVPVRATWRHCELGEMVAPWRRSPQLREACRAHRGHVYGSAEAAFVWAFEQKRCLAGGVRAEGGGGRARRGRSAARRGGEEEMEEEEEEEGEDVAATLAALRRRERRLRRRMKQLLWYDLPAQRNDAEWEDYVDSLSKGVRVMSMIRNEGEAMVRSMA